MDEGGSERQWPYDATRLEILAHRSELEADELREWLRDRIGVQPRATTERVAEAEVRYVELHGDSPEELAAAVAAMSRTKAD